jgi:hypothetical protein
MGAEKEKNRPTGYRDAPQDQQPWSSPAPRTGLVSSVAATNLLTGGLFFYLGYWWSTLPSGGIFTIPGLFWFGPLLAAVGVPYLLAAVAVWKRWIWGLTLAVALSALLALCAVFVLGYMTDARPHGAVLLAWAAYPNIVLLQRRHAAEFAPIIFPRAG